MEDARQDLDRLHLALAALSCKTIWARKGLKFIARDNLQSILLSRIQIYLQS